MNKEDQRKQLEQKHQPISIELLPTPDACAVVILFRSNAKISLGSLAETLEFFVGELKEKIAASKSKIEVPSKKIIIPG